MLVDLCLKWLTLTFSSIENDTYSAVREMSKNTLEGVRKSLKFISSRQKKQNKKKQAETLINMKTIQQKDDDLPELIPDSNKRIKLEKLDNDYDDLPDLESSDEEQDPEEQGRKILEDIVKPEPERQEGVLFL